MAAPTLIYLDGFEYGLTTLSAIGGGIGTTIANTAAITCDSTVKRTGGYSLKITQDGANATSISKTIASATVLVVSFYFRATTNPAAVSNIFLTNSTSNGVIRIETDGKMSALLTSGTAQTTAASVVDSNWHLIDVRFDVSANPNTIDWKVDGAAQTQATRAVAASTVTTIRYGSAQTTANLTYWIDDVVISATTGDYPIGSTTVPHAVYQALPSGDGTHNAGTNTIEDNAGNDIHATNFPANGLIDNWPPDTAAYVRQATVDTSAYAEVTFANHSVLVGTIWDAQAMLAYVSSTNAANEGACIVSFDAFSTSTEVYGTPAARTNYQTTLTTAPGYKVKNAASADGLITRPGGGWTTTDFDNLKARVGYSNDVTGNPRWVALMVQYAGTGAGLGGGADTEYAGMVPI